MDNSSKIESCLKNNFNSICLSIKSNKYPLLITIGFFIIMFYLAFFHNSYWDETVGLYYFHVGEEILAGNGDNVKILNAPLGGPVLFASLNLLFHDPFSVVKTISLLSGTGIVFFSFYIIRNIFNFKVALVGQLFVALTAPLEINSILERNELFPIFLIFFSLYFITRKNWPLYDLYISNISSYPADKNNLYEAIADYVIYKPSIHDPNTTWYVKEPHYADLTILSNPNNPRMPSNFELLYKSNTSGTVVYKINHHK